MVFSESMKKSIEDENKRQKDLRTKTQDDIQKSIDAQITNLHASFNLQDQGITLEEFKNHYKLYENHNVNIVPRVVVIENPFARTMFPVDLLNGHFDERWKMQNGEYKRVFVGNKLKELEVLRENRHLNYSSL